MIKPNFNGAGMYILPQVREIDIAEKYYCLMYQTGDGGGFSQGNDYVIEISGNIQDIYLRLELTGPDDE